MVTVDVVKGLRKTALAVCIASMSMCALAADVELSATLKKIKDEGVVVIGYRESSIPFSYYNDQKQPVGYSIDFANLIVERIKTQLELPDLKVRMLPITSQNRISLLQNGTFDFECTTTTHNESREQQVDFSNNIFVVGTRLLTKQDSGITDFPDLANNTVVVGAGTTSEILLRKMNVEQKLGMRIISAKDHSESFLTLSTGRARAMMMDDALLAGERAKVKDPNSYVITGTAKSYETYGCMRRKGDEQLGSLMDKVIADTQTSGEGLTIYNKWFMSDIPPKQMNLHFPISEAMQALFEAPNNRIQP